MPLLTVPREQLGGPIEHSACLPEQRHGARASGRPWRPRSCVRGKALCWWGGKKDANKCGNFLVGGHGAWESGGDDDSIGSGKPIDGRIQRSSRLEAQKCQQLRDSVTGRMGRGRSGERFVGRREVMESHGAEWCFGGRRGVCSWQWD